MRGPIPQHYVVEEGKLLAGEYPGDHDPRLSLERLRHLVGRGIRVFIDLTTDHDPLLRYESHLAPLENEGNITLHHHRLGIPDMGIPENPAVMRSILDSIAKAIEKSPAAYVHCWGGIGRTGTVIGCLLRENGAGPEEALERVQDLYSTMPKSSYNPYSPQTPAQRTYVREWRTRKISRDIPGSPSEGFS